MAQYVKPGIKFVTLNVASVAAGNCTTSGEDLKLICEVFGIRNIDRAFSITEACIDQYPVEAYCKFTSAENGSATVVLGS